MSRLLHGARPTLSGRALRFLNGPGAALIVFLALWFLYFTGREGLSAEPPKVQFESTLD